jgi:2-acylglycerol O-acyltransferase 2
VHPHGVLTAGWTWNMFFNKDFHKMTGKVGFLMDEGLRIKNPTFRLMADWCESDSQWAGSATRSVMLKAMEKGDSSLALLPGGFQEATLCAMGKDRVYIKGRAGFVKYCLMHGYAITPVYTFGESDTCVRACASELWGPRAKGFTGGGSPPDSPRFCPQQQQRRLLLRASP